MMNYKVVVVVVLCVVSTLSIFIIRNLALWLYVDESLPENCDLIFSFGGDHKRMLYASELKRKYPESKIVVSGKKYDWVLKKMAVNGLDSSNTQFIDTFENTLAEMQFIKEYSEKLVKDFDVILISSPHHMRRISYLKNKLLSSAEGTYHMTPVPLSFYEDYKGYDLKLWWKNKKLRKFVLSEIFKMILSLFI